MTSGMDVISTPTRQCPPCFLGPYVPTTMRSPGIRSQFGISQYARIPQPNKHTLSTERTKTTFPHRKASDVDTQPPIQSQKAFPKRMWRPGAHDVQVQALQSPAVRSFSTTSPLKLTVGGFSYLVF
jgi:hypothetical protein